MAKRNENNKGRIAQQREIARADFEDSLKTTPAWRLEWFPFDMIARAVAKIPGAVLDHGKVTAEDRAVDLLIADFKAGKLAPVRFRGMHRDSGPTDIEYAPEFSPAQWREAERTFRECLGWDKFREYFFDKLVLRRDACQAWFKVHGYDWPKEWEPASAGALEAGLEDGEAQRGPVSYGAIETFYRDTYVPECVQAGLIPSWKKDQAALEKHFQQRIPGKLVKAIRSAHARDEWKTPGVRRSIKMELNKKTD